MVFNHSLDQLVLRFLAYLFIAAVHGLVVAATAYALGDKGPRYDGRLRINPLAHLDVIGTISGVLFSAGWIRPVAIDPDRLHLGGIAIPRFGLVVVVMAATAATLASAAGLVALRPLILPLMSSDTFSTTTFAVIEIATEQSFWFALVNLVPLPPLTGAHLLIAINSRWRRAIARLTPYGAVAIILLAAFGLVSRLIGPLLRLPTATL